MKKYISYLFLALAFSATAILIFPLLNRRPTTSAMNNRAGIAKKNTLKPPQESLLFDKSKYSISDPSSIWAVINKTRGLQPPQFVPLELSVLNIEMRSNIRGDERYLRTDAAKALEAMVRAAADDNIKLNLQSGYRSYSLQVALYNSYVARDGQAAADTYSARPGFSEHQTGLAADIGGVSNPSCNVASCFSETLEGKWLASHVYIYGFIIRYTSNKQAITGYQPEPWHIRYIGTDLSNEMHRQGITTLEEFFSLPAAPTYTQ